VADKNQQFNIQELADKWAQGNITPEEQAYLENWYAQFDDEHIKLTDSRHDNADELRTAMLNRINAHIRQGEKPIRTLSNWKWISVAASVLIVLSAGGYFILHKKPVQQLAQNQKQDIAPGKNQATLTLANGKKIILTKSFNGVLAQQGNTNIQMNAAGIAYKGTADNELQYNTLSTARGETSPLPLILGDGTKVWLNAASSITYPVAFSGRNRKVTVNGEALFEVAHNTAKPFRVTSGSLDIEDIGTTFDVNTYADEGAQKTTLIEGSVKVNGTILKPGQQSSWSDSKVSVTNADIQETIAWKDGKFHFSNEKLSEIMLQTSRWYNVEVVYDNENLKNKTFGVIGNRFDNVSQLLKTLELPGDIKFKIEGQKITVYNK
jgi:ferric-dicitrate binding protein FerR (iron transport regulator)